jgi:nucleoside-diphosphate-sugar epimerase
MTSTIFLAGAAGAIGRQLIPMLVADGWRVVGTTRSTSKVALIETAGAEAVVVDVFDAARLEQAVVAAKPDVVIHQLTDLSPGAPSVDESRKRNAELREVGTRHLVAAAVRAGARRLIAQSISFAYAPGTPPYRETDPLNDQAPGMAGTTARGVASLEAQVLAAPLHGIVLRYGRLYGPGTGVDMPPKDGPLHVREAARAAVLAVTRGDPGIYNIAEDDGYVDVGKAKRGLGMVAVG